MEKSGIVPYPEEFARAYLADGLWGAQSIGDVLHRQCLANADRIAVATPDRRLTYRQLDELSDRCGAALLGRGLDPGDRAVFQVTNTIEGVVAYYGAVKVGVVPVCSIPHHGERDVLTLARMTRASAYVFQRDFPSQDLSRVAASMAEAGVGLQLDLGPEVVDQNPCESLLGGVSAGEARQIVEAHDPDPAEVAVLQLSGGTTGTPKVIPRLHREYVYNSTCWAEAWGWRPDSVVVHPIPLLHNAGLAAALQPSHFAAATFATLPRPSAGDLLDLIERERVTVMPVTPPALLRDLLDAQELQPRDVSSLEQVVVAGQKLDPLLADRLERVLGIDCLQNFGMGEGTFMYTPPGSPEWVRKETVGLPISPRDEVRILRPGDEVQVEIGEVGELCCRGPYTIRGYYDAPQRNSEAFTTDGFYRTGDLARAHRFGDRMVYSIDGRIKDMINRGAEKISAEEVEEVLVEHAAIRAAAVVAMPDERLGERACAYLVASPEAQPLGLEEVVEFCLGRGMAKFKLPERVEYVEALPLTNVGKVSKRELREDIAARLAAETAAARL